jgi:hypothetical protein
LTRREIGSAAFREPATQIRLVAAFARLGELNELQAQFDDCFDSLRAHLENLS